MSDYTECTKEEFLDIINELEKEAVESERRSESLISENDELSEVINGLEEEIADIEGDVITCDNLNDEEKRSICVLLFDKLTLSELQTLVFWEPGKGVDIQAIKLL